MLDGKETFENINNDEEIRYNIFLTEKQFLLAQMLAKNKGMDSSQLIKKLLFAEWKRQINISIRRFVKNWF
jgi:hypothetical protein